MDPREAFITETINLLKTRYEVSLSEIIDLYTGEATIPANIYDNQLTPLEATTQYLIQTRNYTEKEVAQALPRRTSTITAAHKNAQEKNVQLPADNNTPHRIPLNAFDEILSPAETIIEALHQQGLKNSEIAQLLGKDPRNIWQQLKRAQQKRGEKQ